MITKINEYKTLNEIAINVGNFLFFKMDIEYKEIKAITARAAIIYANEKLLCSVIEINKV